MPTAINSTIAVGSLALSLRGLACSSVKSKSNGMRHVHMNTISLQQVTDLWTADLHKITYTFHLLTVVPYRGGTVRGLGREGMPTSQRPCAMLQVHNSSSSSRTQAHPKSEVTQRLCSKQKRELAAGTTSTDNATTLGSCTRACMRCTMV